MGDGKKVTSAVVCGGRTYGCLSVPPYLPDSPTPEEDAVRAARERDRFKLIMTRAVANLGIDTIIEGGAKGADRLARDFAIERDLSLIEIRADWAKEGKRAGPIRNMMMLAQKPDYVLAFPGGNGTAHMVGAAKATGFTVYELK